MTNVMITILLGLWAMMCAAIATFVTAEIVWFTGCDVPTSYVIGVIMGAVFTVVWLATFAYVMD